MGWAKGGLKGNEETGENKGEGRGNGKGLIKANRLYSMSRSGENFPLNFGENVSCVEA